VFDIGLNRAVTLIAEKVAKGPSKGRFGADPGKPLGDHPSLGAVALKNGRYGAYVTAGGVNATIPSDKDKDAVTLAEAIALIDERAAKGGKSGKAAKKAKSTKTGAKKTAKKTVETAAKSDEDADAPKPDVPKPAKKAAVKKAAAKPKPESTSKARAPVATAAKTTAAKPAAKAPAKKSAGKARG
jgi:DNA topoisomerase-1